MYVNRFQHLYGIARTRIPEPDGVVMRLQRNEKPDSWPESLRRRIFENVPADLLQRYPDAAPFYGKLAAFLGVDEENLVVTSGIDEAVKSLITLCCEPGNTFAVPLPGYAMYEVYGRILGARVVPIKYHPERFTDVDALVAVVPTDAKILFLPNPHQPVENCFDLEQLRRIAEWCAGRDMLFAIDEAYCYFGAPSSIPLTAAFDNVLVMRTFSKAFGAASLRLSYVVGSPAAVKPLAAFRLAHEANALSLYVGSALIDAFDTEVRTSIEAICAGRDFLRETCRARGLGAWGAVSNNVLIDLGDAATMAAVVDDLAGRGILVKGHFPKPLDHYILVTCGPVEMMKMFVDSLFDCLNDTPLPDTQPLETAR